MACAHDEPADMTPAQRRREIAALLARGVLRLRQCAENPNNATEKSEKSWNPSQDCLAEMEKTSLHVPTG